jgi:hypothetical protein
VGLTVVPLEPLTGGGDVERQVLEHRDSARREREGEVLPLPLGAELASSGSAVLARGTRRLRPRGALTPHVAEQLAQHPLRPLEELAPVGPPFGTGPPDPLEERVGDRRATPDP